MVEVARGSRDDLEEVVFVAGGVVDFEDAFELEHLFEEGGAAGGTIEDDCHEGSQRVAGELGVEAGGIAEDDTTLLETVDAVSRGGRGVADEMGKLGPGGAGVADQSAQKFRIQTGKGFHILNRKR